jgi:hypothetical protein
MHKKLVQAYTLMNKDPALNAGSLFSSLSGACVNFPASMWTLFLISYPQNRIRGAEDHESNDQQGDILEEGVVPPEKCYPIQAAADPHKGRYDAEVDL